MFPSALAHLFFLLAGTPPEASQMTLTVMFVAFGVLLIGIGFPRISKTKQSLLQHRWTLTVAVALTLGAVLLVMLPSAFRFFIDPNVNLLSTLSIITLVHAVIGVPAATIALIYVFGDLPVNVRMWMRITAALWVATMAVGVVLFLQMLALI
jgi:uncharacterized membrane protein YozB (DUF420 family)